MAKHTQTIRHKQQRSCLSVFDHFLEVALKGLGQMSKLLRQPALRVHSIVCFECSLYVHTESEVEVNQAWQVE